MACLQLLGNQHKLHRHESTINGNCGVIAALNRDVLCWSPIISLRWCHNGHVGSQITSLTIVYSIDYSGADQRKHQSSVSLAFVWGIHRGPVNSPHKWPVTWKMFPFDDVIMWGSYPMRRPLHVNNLLIKKINQQMSLMQPSYDNLPVWMNRTQMMKRTLSSFTLLWLKFNGILWMTVELVYCIR